MTRSQLHVVVATTLLTAFVGGCTSVSTGDPRPIGSATSTNVETTTTSVSPTRPREIRLDDTDPCTLLPQADYAKFELDNKPGEPKTDNHGADACLWQGDLGYMGATMVTYEGVEAQEGRYAQMKPADPIEEFPAYNVTLPDDENGCFVMVDVADGEYVIVQVGLDDTPTDRPTCDYAHDFAASIMGTLVAQ